MMELVPRLMLLLRRHSHAVLGQEMSFTSLRVLLQVNTHGPLCPGELAANMGVSRPAMTKICQGLVRQGLIRKQKGNRDGRSHLLALNPSGQRRVDRFREELQQRLSAQLESQLSLPQRKRLDQALQTLQEIYP